MRLCSGPVSDCFKEPVRCRVCSAAPQRRSLRSVCSRLKSKASRSRSPHRAPQHASVALASPPQRIPVKEPVRTKPPALAMSALRPKTVTGVRAHGVHVDGPPMLRPTEIDRVISAARRRTAAAAPAKAIAPPVRTVPRPPSSGTRPGTRRALSLPSDPTASGTGINPWWRYQEQNVPGGGHVMVNVGTGNMLLQDDDMSVPHKGIAMAFRRTYNSQMRPRRPRLYDQLAESCTAMAGRTRSTLTCVDFADGGHKVRFRHRWRSL